MSPEGFEPTISASKRQQSHVFDRAAIVTDRKAYREVEFLTSGRELRGKPHIPAFSTHRDKVSGNQCGQQ